MYSVYVSGEKIDTLNTKGIVLNITLFDILNPDKKGVNFSNNIVLPVTKKNVRIFEINSSDIFSRTFEADIYDKTMHIIKGNIKIISLGDYITVQIADISKQLFIDLGKPLHELDLSGDDFVYNMASYNNLKNATTGAWSWELIDNRFSLAVDNMKITDLDPNISVFRPHFIVLEIIREIIEQNGFEADFSALDDECSNLRLLSNANGFLFSTYQTTSTSITLPAGTNFPLPTTGAEDYIWHSDFILMTFNYIIKEKAVQYKLAFEVDIEEDAILQVKQESEDDTGAGYESIKEFTVYKTGVFITDWLDTERRVKIFF